VKTKDAAPKIAKPPKVRKASAAEQKAPAARPAKAPKMKAAPVASPAATISAIFQAQKPVARDPGPSKSAKKGRR